MKYTPLFSISPVRSLVIGSVALLAFPPTAGAESATVGDPAHPDDLPLAIYRAHDQGARDITVAPGTYDLPSMNGQDTLKFEQWRDTTIHATGATLIFEELKHRPVHFIRCNKVTWDGGTLLFVHPSFTQGRITAIGTDDSGSYCDWQIDAGYPTDIDPIKATYDVVDQKTRVIKVDTGDWGVHRAEQTGPGVFRLHYDLNRGPKFAVNDWLVTRAPGGSTIVHLDGSQDCTIENVVLQNAGFAAFFETGGEGGNHYFKCKLQPGPRPPGATEDELVGCGADGFHSVDTATGPDIEDCEFTGVFLDDCFAVHGSFDRVLSSSGNSITLESAHPMPQPGDPIRIADMKGFFAQAKCVSATRGENNTVIVTLDQTLQVPIDHGEDGDKRKGTKACDPNYCGRGYKILRCRLGDTRSRGILVKSDDGLIDGCKIEGCGMSGVSVGPEFWWGEAGYCWNVTISHNTFLNCDKKNDEQAAMWIHGDGAIGNQNITIENNQFDACYGKYIIRSDWADGLKIASNRIAQSFQLPLGKPGNVIWLDHSKNINLLGNLVSEQGSSAGDLVGLDASVTAADVTNNGDAGIKISAAAAK